MFATTQAYPAATKSLSPCYQLHMRLAPSGHLYNGVALATLVLTLLAVLAIVTALGVSWQSALLVIVYAGMALGHWIYFRRWQYRQRGILDVRSDTWCWQSNATTPASHDWRIVDDVVVWSWLIILPLGNIATGQRKRLVILRDSTTTENQRKLCVYLKTRYWKSSSRHQ